MQIGNLTHRLVLLLNFSLDRVKGSAIASTIASDLVGIPGDAAELLRQNLLQLLGKSLHCQGGDVPEHAAGVVELAKPTNHSRWSLVMLPEESGSHRQSGELSPGSLGDHAH